MARKTAVRTSAQQQQQQQDEASATDASPQQRRTIARKSVTTKPRTPGTWTNPRVIATSDQPDTTATIGGRRRQTARKSTTPQKVASATTAAARRTMARKSATTTTPKRTARKARTTPAKSGRTGAAGTRTSRAAGGSHLNVEVYRGPPDEQLTGGWPKGWIKVIQERRNAAINTKGRRDRYWFTPLLRLKIRSMVRVQNFIQNLKKTRGDEQKAFNMLKAK